MKEKIRSSFRITLKKEIRDNFEIKVGDIVEVSILQNSQNISFIAKVQQGNQVRIPSNVRHLLKLEIGKEIICDIKKLQPIDRTNKFFCDNQIDILSLIPSISRKGFSIRTFQKNGKIVVWQDTPKGGVAKPLLINRFVSLNFCKMLGLMQAECKKTISKNGSPMSFTNKLPTLCKVIVDCLRELGIEDSMIKVVIRLPKNCNKTNAEIWIKNFFEITQLKPRKISKNIISESNINANFKHKNAVFEIRVGRTLLTEIIINSIIKLRCFFFNRSSFNESELKAAINFLNGILMGDGVFCIHIDQKKCAVSASMRIEDVDMLNLMECEKIFQKLGFLTSLQKEKSLPRLSIWCNWNLLLWIIFKNKVWLENPFGWIKLILILKRMKQWKTLKRILLFDAPMTSRELGKSLNMTSDRISTWLIRREKEMLVKRVGIVNGFKVVWNLTNKGKELKNLLQQVNKLNSDIERIFGTSEFNEVMKIIKNLNGNEMNNPELMLKIFDWLLAIRNLSF